MPELTIDYEVLPHQKEFLDCAARYAIVCSGTKAGKSVSGAIYAAQRLTSRKNVRGVWVAPTHSQAIGIGMENLRLYLPRQYVSEKLSGVPAIRFKPLNSVIEFKSADEPDNLFGASYDFAVLDEAGRILEESFNAVRSTVTATGGQMRLMSNPTGRTGWFFRLYTRGLDPSDPDVQSFKWKTADNVKIPAAEIADAQHTLSEDTFRALYMGEFLDIGGGVFQGVRECAVGALQEPRPGGVYVGGLDVARKVDYSVATIIDVDSGSVVAWDRWHGNSWEASAHTVAAMAVRYNNAKFWVDSTGVGDIALEQIERAGVNVEGFHFTGPSKAQLIERLKAAIEKRQITFPPKEILLGELESFEGTTGPTGTVRYAAAGSGHDDAVISLGLAVYGMQQCGSGIVLKFIPSYAERRGAF